LVFRRKLKTFSYWPENSIGFFVNKK